MWFLNDILMSFLDCCQYLQQTVGGFVQYFQRSPTYGVYTAFKDYSLTIQIKWVDHSVTKLYHLLEVEVCNSVMCYKNDQFSWILLKTPLADIPLIVRTFFCFNFEDLFIYQISPCQYLQLNICQTNFSQNCRSSGSSPPWYRWSSVWGSTVMLTASSANFICPSDQPGWANVSSTPVCGEYTMGVLTAFYSK